MYLSLINLYLQNSKQIEAKQLTEQLESKLETQLEDPFTFKLFNELANVIRKHDDLHVAV